MPKEAVNRLIVIRALAPTTVNQAIVTDVQRVVPELVGGGGETFADFIRPIPRFPKSTAMMVACQPKIVACPFHVGSDVFGVAAWKWAQSAFIVSSVSGAMSAAVNLVSSGSPPWGVDSSFEDQSAAAM
jgi:hypothetical protein